MSWRTSGSGAVEGVCAETSIEKITVPEMPMARCNTRSCMKEPLQKRLRCSRSKLNHRRQRIRIQKNWPHSQKGAALKRVRRTTHAQDFAPLDIGRHGPVGYIQVRPRF